MLAKAHPHLNIIIQDLPSPIANAQTTITALQPDIRSCVQATEYNLILPQPRRSVDVYLLRTTLHD
ncbi:hypothetical protein COCSADRAFT_248061 [Bipolaris sorokiniana ND90Pr]|nr:uncharacterized protein COCSADRAFT_248061 [Bipolaris sorokiniana ND90Pr]EMD60049.1 hypothetical protein COCSADRAFT_248061 [Bipolaris sorokiniana ND90Pr]